LTGSYGKEGNVKVLLVGEANRVTRSIVDKLHKEGHKVSVLCRDNTKTYRHIYEKYIFDYGNPCVKDVFESVNPDLTIFGGAFDTGFDWGREQDAFLYYTTALSNVISAYSQLGRGRFVYLSSETVYDANASLEELPAYKTMADITRSRAVRQGETTCANYEMATGCDVVVLRIENLSFAPENLSEIINECGRMCVETLNDNELHATGHGMALLALSDAVEFMYRLFVAEKHRRDVYLLRSRDEVRESEAIDEINRAFAIRVPVKLENVQEYIWIEELEVYDYGEEFPMDIYHKTLDCVREIAAAVKKNPEHFQHEGHKEISRLQTLMERFHDAIWTFIPFLENMVCFIPIFMLNNRTVGSRFFARLDWFLLYVLFFAIMYGQQQAAFSAVLAVVGYFFRQMYTQSIFDVAMDYNTYVWMAQLLILGLAVGYLRDQLVLIRGDKDDEIEYVRHRLRDIEDINQSNVRLKKELELQVVNQSDSMGKIYEITSTLDQQEPEEVLFCAADVISRLMDCKHVAVYSVSDGSFARLIAFTSEAARRLGNSVEYNKYGEMMADIDNRRVFINRKMNLELPMMAMGVYSGERLSIIALVWDVPFERMNLSQANRLKIIGLLIQNSTVRARDYMDILVHQRYVGNSNVMDREAFKSLAGAFINAKKKGLTDCAFVKIYNKGQTITELGAEVARYFRSTDYIGELGDGNVYVLLACANQTSVKYVENRLSEAGYEYDAIKELGV
jgi:nucleoside-diphosphate-sugar epimerase